MSQTLQAETRPAAEVVRGTPVSQAPNGICFATMGETGVAAANLDRIIAAVPGPIAAALDRKAYYFVPLTVGQGDRSEERRVGKECRL